MGCVDDGSSSGDSWLRVMKERCSRGGENGLDSSIIAESGGSIQDVSVDPGSGVAVKHQSRTAPVARLDGDVVVSRSGRTPGLDLQEAAFVLSGARLQRGGELRSTSSATRASTRSESIRWSERLDGTPPRSRDDVRPVNG
ncbi:hypothetical protein M6B38_164420 [Iris pallida]|uniref:Uncharacterized protein n=1 Tax=Iris pallida TaxID=29817 RepID=A0AAX6EXP4_IRIPA|nr:hypothetical protein M6B38_164420 [Iris pallida]